MKKSIFLKKTGKVFIPTSDWITVNRNPRKKLSSDALNIERPEYNDIGRKKICGIALREGCYRIIVNRPSSSVSFSPFKYEGTIRIERPDGHYCISGDLYHAKKRAFQQHIHTGQVENPSPVKLELASHPFKQSKIPVYPRHRYYGYLKGIQAYLYSYSEPTDPCQFSLDFDFFEYIHPADEYDGTFATTSSAQFTLALQTTPTEDRYEGVLYEDNVEIGDATLQWLSPWYRKAYLYIHTLEGAVPPEAVPDQDEEGIEDFRSIYATADWDLRVTYKTPNVTIPEDLDGVQTAQACWTRENCHTLLESLSDHNPAILDRKWLIHLIAIPAASGCGLGIMFDNRINVSDIGDLNLIAREGAATFSDVPLNNPLASPHVGDSFEDVPRAYLRSAAHEVGHTFNQIHQAREGQSDNSIMTTTGNLLSLLDSASQVFPDDMSLSFNTRVRHHLIHQPDPAIRPGAISFTGRLSASPEADDVDFLDQSYIEFLLKPHSQHLKLGEPLRLNWSVKNLSQERIIIPKDISDISLTARISVTYPDGTIRFNRPLQIEGEREVPLKPLDPEKHREAQTLLYWNKEGFVFKAPGQHKVDIILLWITEKGYKGLHSSTDIWIDYPTTQEENDVAERLFHKDVGIYVACGGKVRLNRAVERIEKVIKKYDSHPASVQLRAIKKSKKGKSGKKER